MLAQLEKHSVGKAQEWKAVLERYRDGMSWLEQVEQFREGFVNPKHPDDIIEKLQKLRETANTERAKLHAGAGATNLEQLTPKK